MQTWNIPDRKGLMTGRKLSNQCNHMISRRASSVATTQQALHGDTSFHGYNMKLVLALNILWYKFQLLEVIFIVVFSYQEWLSAWSISRVCMLGNNHAKAIHHWLLYPAQQKLLTVSAARSQLTESNTLFCFLQWKEKKNCIILNFFFVCFRKRKNKCISFVCFFILYFFLENGQKEHASQQGFITVRVRNFHKRQSAVNVLHCENTAVKRRKCVSWFQNTVFLFAME